MNIKRRQQGQNGNDNENDISAYCVRHIGTDPGRWTRVADPS